MTDPVEQSQIVKWAVDVTTVLTVLGLVFSFVRLIRGPSLPDRVVSIDLITVLAVAIAGLLAITHNEPDFLDIGVALALVGVSGDGRLRVVRRALDRVAQSRQRGRREGGRDRWQVTFRGRTWSLPRAFWPAASSCSSPDSASCACRTCSFACTPPRRRARWASASCSARRPLYFRNTAETAIAVLTVVFLLVTAPVAAHAIARAAYRMNVRLSDRTHIDEWKGKYGRDGDGPTDGAGTP